MGENWPKGSSFLVRVMVRGEGEWAVQGLELSRAKAGTSPTDPELCIPRAPAVQAPLTPCIPEDLSITAAFSAGAHPWTELKETCILPRRRGLC